MVETIKLGQYSDVVKKIQEALVRSNYTVEITGVYDQSTRDVLDKYKVDKNLQTDQDAINSLFPKKTKINWLGFLGPIILPLITKGTIPMTKAFIMQLVRDGLKLLGGTGVGAGLATADEWTMIAGGVSLVVGIVWGFIARKDDNAAK